MRRRPPKIGGVGAASMHVDHGARAPRRAASVETSGDSSYIHDRMVATTRSGSSSCGTWPTWLSTSNRHDSNFSAAACAWRIETNRSCVPWIQQDRSLHLPVGWRTRAADHPDHQARRLHQGVRVAGVATAFVGQGLLLPRGTRRGSGSGPAPPVAASAPPDVRRRRTGSTTTTALPHRGRRDGELPPRAGRPAGPDLSAATPAR